MAAYEHRRKLLSALFCGALGCACFCAGDWLMLYGDTTHVGSVFWLTEGAAAIPAWRNGLAMALAFPGILLYGIALFYLAKTIYEPKQKHIYQALTAFGLTPWLCLHLFYVVILYAFGWMRQNDFEAAALPTAQAIYAHLSWLPTVSIVLMVPPFLYWFYLQITCKTMFPRWMAVSSVLVFYIVLYGAKMLLPDGAFRIGFTNGLMSESMLLWFAVMAVWFGISGGKKQ